MSAIDSDLRRITENGAALVVRSWVDSSVKREVVRSSSWTQGTVFEMATYGEGGEVRATSLCRVDRAFKTDDDWIFLGVDFMGSSNGCSDLQLQEILGERAIQVGKQGLIHVGCGVRGVCRATAGDRNIVHVNHVRLRSEADLPVPWAVKKKDLGLPVDERARRRKTRRENSRSVYLRIS